MEVDSIEGVKLDKKGGFKYMILSDIITRDGRLTHFERESQSLYEAAKRRFLAPAEGIPHFSMFLISYTLCQLLLSLCATLQSLTRPDFPAPKFFGFLQTRNILPVHSQISFSDIKGVPRVKKSILRILPTMPQISKRSSRSWGFQFLTT